MSQTQMNLTKSKAILIDTTKCVGCRSCQVSCKAWHDLKAEKTTFNPNTGNWQNPNALAANTLAVVTFNEIEDAKSPGGLKYVMAKRQCMHCDEPACASACPVTAMHKTAEGPVVYDKEKCIGCRYCMWACPWGVPTAEWDSLAPKISKCTMCHDRCNEADAPVEQNGVALSTEQSKALGLKYAVPACVKQCAPGALEYGNRQQLLKTARDRMAASPGKYVDHVYGEHEAGGTATLYLSSVPFEQLGFPKIRTESYPKKSAMALKAVPPAVIVVGAALGGTYALKQRAAVVAKAEAPAIRKELPASKVPVQDAHVEFAPIEQPLWTMANKLLVAVMAFGGLSFLARFALGLGGATNLNDTYAWGLWIVFDLVWIAVAAGAFAMAGVIYVFQRKDLYSIGRSAVLMGLLSYSFVTVTLLADLGLPWHFYQLGMNAPEHSAMFEVSWCVGLYVTILAFEFMPVPFERWGMKGAMELWKKYSNVWVAFAVPLFVYLMSRSLAYTAVALAVFGFLGYAFRAKPGQKPVPVMLAIAAVTLSTMHQSSLGSLFLLMPDKLSHLWWSPILPVNFFVSSIAAGIALVVLVEMWTAKAWGRTMRATQLASVGKIAFYALLAYEALRIGDLVVRGQLANGPKSGLFMVEMAMGLLALALLASSKVRETPSLLAIGAFLSMGSIVMNRVNVVVGGMHLPGAPGGPAQSYFPSVFEWGVSFGLIAASIFLFGLGARLMPVLPKEDAGH